MSELTLEQETEISLDFFKGYLEGIEKFQCHIDNLQLKNNEITFDLILPNPIKYIRCDFILEDNHKGMIFNPYSNKWSYL